MKSIQKQNFDNRNDARECYVIITQRIQSMIDIGI